jgi:hypothetical protein
VLKFNAVPPSTGSDMARVLNDDWSMRRKTAASLLLYGVYGALFSDIQLPSPIIIATANPADAKLRSFFITVFLFVLLSVCLLLSINQANFFLFFVKISSA